MQKAVISEPTKTLGQNMLQNEPKEVFAFGGTVAGFAGTAFDVFKCDIAVLIGDDTAFTNDAPVKVPRQVFQSGQTFSRVSAVDNPLSRQRIGQSETGLVQSLKKASTKHLGQSEFIEQVSAFFLFPLLPGFVHAAARHHDMNMRMVIQATVMSMQYCGHTDVGAEIFGIYAKVFQRAGSARKKKVVNEGLVVPCQESELIGERKGCHEVLNRQQLGLLPVQPERGFMVLALWATAMPAGTGTP